MLAFICGLERRECVPELLSSRRTTLEQAVKETFVLASKRPFSPLQVCAVPCAVIVIGIFISRDPNAPTCVPTFRHSSCMLGLV